MTINPPPTDDDDSLSSYLYADDDDEGSDNHTGFYLGDGEDRIHVFGNPAMSEETKQALLRLAECVRDWMDKGDTLPDTELPFAAFDEGE